jgi:hypothetical protein
LYLIVAAQEDRIIAGAHGEGLAQFELSNSNPGRSTYF